LSPLKEIPARKPTKATQSPTRSPARKNIPVNTNGGLSLQNQRISPQPLLDLGADPLGDEETEEEKRKKEKEQAIKARDARRKSLGRFVDKYKIGLVLTAFSQPKSLICARSHTTHLGHDGGNA